MTGSLAAIIGDADPGYAEALEEDCRSLNESAPYVIRGGDATGHALCSRCGTAVARVPEGRAADGPRRQFQPAVWELVLGRKHTIRRCDWLREHRR